MVEELYTPEQLDKMHQQLWQCVLQFANFSATQERNRIAQDLHDSLGHALTAVNFQLQTAIKLCKPDPN
ncbi:histidine kinase dimerization/phosphoacceptor domain-containing protein [Nostoc sp.]|uniref:histidine kinase dimerization/phosphoacceptor domain-containing protein n=1 Tax=Nostoc sp. TaxID=1180 RepID=UPI002FFA7317